MQMSSLVESATPPSIPRGEGGAYPFCNIPSLAKLDFCCADSVDATKGTDDQSHSTISDENNHDLPPILPAVAKSNTTSSFHALENFFAHLNKSICGHTTGGELPSPADIAMPIHRGSSHDKSQRACEDRSLHIKDVASILDTFEDDDPVDPEEENEVVANDTVVIYFTNSGSTDGENPDWEDQNAHKEVIEPSLQQLVPVAMGTWDLDDPIHQEMASSEYRDPSVPEINRGLETTIKVLTGPIRFQNLATGSFCDISTDSDVPCSAAYRAELLSVVVEEDEECEQGCVNAEEALPDSEGKAQMENEGNLDEVAVAEDFLQAMSTLEEEFKCNEDEQDADAEENREGVHVEEEENSEVKEDGYDKLEENRGEEDINDVLFITDEEPEMDASEDKNNTSFYNDREQAHNCEKLEGEAGEKDTKYCPPITESDGEPTLDASVDQVTTSCYDLEVECNKELLGGEEGEQGIKPFPFITTEEATMDESVNDRTSSCYDGLEEEHKHEVLVRETGENDDKPAPFIACEEPMLDALEDDEGLSCYNDDEEEFEDCQSKETGVPVNTEALHSSKPDQREESSGAVVKMVSLLVGALDEELD